jgi:hypothetical protein
MMEELHFYAFSGYDKANRLSCCAHEHIPEAQNTENNIKHLLCWGCDNAKRLDSAPMNIFSSTEHEMKTAALTGIYIALTPRKVDDS